MINLQFYVFFAVIITLVACNPVPTVRVPDSAYNDKVPVIKITNSLQADGAVDKGEVEKGQDWADTVFVTKYSKLLIVGTATNEIGGVKSFSIRITQGQNVLYSVQSESTQTNGYAPISLGIIGSDGNGNAGVIEPIDPTISDYIQLIAEATNFNEQTTKLILVYTPLEPLKAEISVNPADIVAGRHATLYWNYNTPNATNVSLTSSTNGVSTSINSGGQNYIDVAPVTPTIYTLEVSQPFQGTKVGFPNASPNTGQTIHETKKTVTATLNVTQPPSPTGQIIASYYFNGQFITQPFENDVRFIGVLVSPSGNVGNTSFDEIVKAPNLFPDPHNRVDFSKKELRKGTWQVTALSVDSNGNPGGVAGTIQCNVNVLPLGLVQLRLDGDSPSCQ